MIIGVRDMCPETHTFFSFQKEVFLHRPNQPCLHESIQYVYFTQIDVRNVLHAVRRDVFMSGYRT